MVLKGYAKAIAGGVVAAASWLAGASAEGGIAGPEWGALPLAFLVGAGVVAAVKNSED